MKQNRDYATGQISPFIRAIPSYVLNEFTKYLLASGVALTVDIGFLYLLTDIFGIHYQLSATISFSLGLVIVYLFSIAWVFDSRRLSVNMIELFVFFSIGIIGLGINALGLYLLTDIAGFYYIYSKAFTTILVFSWNFNARKTALFS